MGAIWKDCRGGALVEAAVVLPLIFLCAIGLLQMMMWMYTSADEAIADRAAQKWKIEHEAEWIRNGELINAQLHP